MQMYRHACLALPSSGLQLCIVYVQNDMWLSLSEDWHVPSHFPAYTRAPCDTFTSPSCAHRSFSRVTNAKGSDGRQANFGEHGGGGQCTPFSSMDLMFLYVHSGVADHQPQHYSAIALAVRSYRAPRGGQAKTRLLSLASGSSQCRQLPHRTPVGSLDQTQHQGLVRRTQLLPTAHQPSTVSPGGMAPYSNDGHFHTGHV